MMKKHWKHASAYLKEGVKDREDLKKLIYIGGDKYGGYPIVKDILSSDSICYCAGAARDISFEEDLFNLCQPFIYIFEPTPSHFKWVKNAIDNSNHQLIRDKIKYYEIGLDGENCQMEFYPDGGSDSWSSYKKKNGNLGNSIKVQMKKLSSLMEENHHSKLDLLKIDIEGSEYNVIEDIIANKLDIDMIAMEMHGDWIHDFRDDTKQTTIPNNKTYKEYITKLENYGYKLVWSLNFRDHLLIKKELI
jgi:FkbM family methyltransferase